MIQNLLVFCVLFCVEQIRIFSVKKGKDNVWIYDFF